MGHPHFEHFLVTPILSDSELQTDSGPILVTATRFAGPGPNDVGESLVENRHAGWVVISNLQQDLMYCTPGAGSIATFFRSAAKPFQAYPLVTSGASKSLTTEELAVTCASHSGSIRHLTLARSILDKAGLPENALQCGPHMPSDATELKRLQDSGKAPCALHNNCSGKHAGMLFYCTQAGLDPASYLDPAHSLQQEILDGLKHWTGLEDIPVGIDGCGAPVFHLPLAAMAGLYAQLSVAHELRPLREAMTAYPEIVGGENRIDTVLMQVSQGKLLAKVGADGVICVSRVGYGEGLALKIGDGSNDVRNLAVTEILLRLNWLEEKEAADPRLKPWRDAMQRTNTQGRHVGDYRVHLNLSLCQEKASDEHLAGTA